MYGVDYQVAVNRNLLKVAQFLVYSSGEDCLDSQNCLVLSRSICDLLTALHECYRIAARIPHVFEVEMVLKKLEEDGEEENVANLSKYTNSDFLPVFRNLLDITVNI
ncbi:unnamed protein product [Meloidogyne enterolobii]|uniref:Uncharacterized protein n=3 Tax=Meloidogyne enterolobii TaxID=390850 RepID=A0ACB0YMY3_MELEN